MAFSEFISNPAGWIGDMVRRGLSQNAAESEARRPLSEGGMEYRGSHAAFRAAFQDIRADFLNRSALSDLDYEAPIPDLYYKPWNAGGQGAYVHQVTVYQWSPEIGGNINIQWTVRSDTPLSPAEAELRAADEATEGAAWSPGGDNLRVMGAKLTGTYYAYRSV